jgi:hypothetical protein
MWARREQAAPARMLTRSPPAFRAAVTAIRITAGRDSSFSTTPGGWSASCRVPRRPVLLLAGGREVPEPLLPARGANGSRSPHRHDLDPAGYLGPALADPEQPGDPDGQLLLLRPALPGPLGHESQGPNRATRDRDTTGTRTPRSRAFPKQNVQRATASGAVGQRFESSVARSRTLARSFAATDASSGKGPRDRARQRQPGSTPSAISPRRRISSPGGTGNEARVPAPLAHSRAPLRKVPANEAMARVNERIDRASERRVPSPLEMVRVPFAHSSAPFRMVVASFAHRTLGHSRAAPLGRTPLWASPSHRVASRRR